MTQASEQITVESGLPAFCEALRMVSGLLAVAAVAIIVLASSLIAEQEARPAETSAIPAGTIQPVPPQDRRTVAVPAEPSSQLVFVFYLVATAAQADLADWGEQVSAHETWSSGFVRADRKYEILYARDDNEAQAAGTTILDRMVEHGRSVTAEVIDLRTVQPGP